MKSVVLLSGGVDSATCLALAVSQYTSQNVAALRVFYGQRHAKELECSRKVAEHYGVKPYDLDLSACFTEAGCPLLEKNHEAQLPTGSYAQQQRNAEGVVGTYVPFRNGLMLSAATSMAMGIFPDDEVGLYIGAHADDAAGNAYPDCSEDFALAMKQAIKIGTYGRVNLVAPLVNMNKAQVVSLGLDLGVPYQMTWSCYAGGERPCGKCGTCIDRAAAFAANGIEDPALKVA